MIPAAEAFAESWPRAPWLAASLLVSLAVYSRGWRWLRRRDPGRWSFGRWLAMAGAFAALYLALASPIEAWADLLLQMHMLQHLLLMMVAPPLVWIAAPLFPMLRGLPAPVRRYWASPLLRSAKLRAVFATLTHPLVAGPLFVGATWLWHAPRMYELALMNPVWHRVEHATFLAAALLFWYPILRPYPARPRWSPWLLLPYLLAADIQNTVLAAWLTFSSRVLYPHYAAVPRIGGLTALDDQAAAGVLMWVPGSVAFLVPLAVIAWRLMLSPVGWAQRSAGPPLEPRPQRQMMVLRALRERGRPHLARRCVQIAMLLLAVAIVWDGLAGPRVAPMNLAGVAPWIHWRGAVVLGLLAVGNISCLACPFTLPRAWAARWLPEGRPWPRALRNKWLALALVALFLWSYECFSLWDRPGLTAWIVVGYFVTAFAVDACFQGAAFCKYVCPIGQFNFVQSLISPLEVRVRDPEVCAGCRTHDCLQGGPRGPGCGLQLFQPRKLGNFDCTFCLDCVQACPQENVSLLPGSPTAALMSGAFRSGVGRWTARGDVAALVAVLTFGALANAAGMVGPVVGWQTALAERLGGASRELMVTLFYVAAIVIAPAATLIGAAFLSRRWGRLAESTSQVATRFAFALIPLGFAMWLAHYSFHLATSYGAIVPVVQRMAGDQGLALGDPAWAAACCAAPPDWLWKAEVLALDVGLLGSLYVAFLLAEPGGKRRALAAWLPWALLIAALFACAVWIVLQPMEMRGTLGGGG